MCAKSKVRLSSLFIFLGLYVSIFTGIHAQKFSADVEIFLQDSSLGTLTFGRYNAGQMLRVDTVLPQPNTKSYRIKGENLSSGVFFVGTKQKLLFNFVLTPLDNRFTIRQIEDSFHVEGSAENVAFFEFSKTKSRIEQQIEQSKQMLDLVAKATKSDREALMPIEEGINQHYKSIDRLRTVFCEKHPDFWFSNVLKSIEVRPLPIDIKPQLENGKPNPKARKWYRSHYFDQTNFEDSTLLHNDLWPLFFNQYFVTVAHSEPDSFSADIDNVMAKMPSNGPIFRYSLRRLIENVEQAIYPGQDRVFVHLVDHYTGNWIDQATLLRMKGKADSHRGNLTGNLAPPLNGLTYSDGVPFHLDSIKSPFTLLIFYSPLCHHCMEELPGVYETWLKYKKSGLNAISVATDDKIEFWKGFLLNKDWKWINIADPSGKLAFKDIYAAYNLPVIYLLDAKKRILWKRIMAKNLELVLSQYITIKE